MDVQKFELCEGPVESIEFPPGSVPVHIAAKVYGRDSCWVRACHKGQQTGTTLYRGDGFEERQNRLLYFSEKIVGGHRVCLERRAVV